MLGRNCLWSGQDVIAGGGLRLGIANASAAFPNPIDETTGDVLTSAAFKDVVGNGIKIGMAASLSTTARRWIIIVSCQLGNSALHPADRLVERHGWPFVLK